MKPEFHLRVPTMQGYVPQDGEHVIIDGQEYIAHEEYRICAEGFWDDHCRKCVFNYHKAGIVDCDVYCSPEVQCFSESRYVYFEKAKSDKEQEASWWNS